jgi:hypothetical protein
LEVEEGQAGAEGAVWVGRKLPVPAAATEAIGVVGIRNVDGW